MVRGKQPWALAEQMRVRSAGARERIEGDHRLRTLNVEEVQDDARIRAKGAAEADVGEQRVGDLARRARHAYPQNLARRHRASKLGAAFPRTIPRGAFNVPKKKCERQFAWRPVCAFLERRSQGRGEDGGGLAHICCAGRRVPV